MLVLTSAVLVRPVVKAWSCWRRFLEALMRAFSAIHV
jgi:hypothetical protein